MKEPPSRSSLGDWLIPDGENLRLAFSRTRHQSLIFARRLHGAYAGCVIKGRLTSGKKKTNFFIFQYLLQSHRHGDYIMYPSEASAIYLKFHVTFNLKWRSFFFLLGDKNKKKREDYLNENIRKESNFHFLIIHFPHPDGRERETPRKRINFYFPPKKKQKPNV